MSRHTLLGAIALGFFVTPLVFGSPAEGQIKWPVMIYEVCIKPSSVSEPKWVELRSFSTNDVNLKGYSLHDRSVCFYEFKEDCPLEAAKTLVLYFHSWKHSAPRAGLHYSHDLSKYPERVAETNSNPFSGKAILAGSYWEGVPKDEHRALNVLETSFLTMEQYDYLGRLADEYRERSGLRNVSKPVVMSNLSRLYRESDEIALVDGDGRIVSFVGWGAGTFLEHPATSKWEKAAMKAGLCPEREIIGSVGMFDNIFTYPHIILERCGPDATYFRRKPFGTPGETQCKEPIQKLTLRLNGKTGEIWAEARVRSSSDRWKLVLEIAARSDFEEVVYRKEQKTLGLPWLEPPVRMDVDLTDEQIRALSAVGRWFYRARREFNDGDSTDWTKGEEPIYSRTWLSDFQNAPSGMTEGLIEARRKWRESRKNKEPSAVSAPGGPRGQAFNNE